MGETFSFANSHADGGTPLADFFGIQQEGGTGTVFPGGCGGGEWAMLDDFEDLFHDAGGD